MTISYNGNYINPIEERIIEMTKNVSLSLLFVVSKSPLIIFWFLGMILLITIGLLYTLVFYVPLLISRKATKSDINKLITDSEYFDQRKAMETLASIQSFNIWVKGVIEKGNNFFVLVPIIYELKKTSGYLTHAEKVLTVKAYPEQKPLTKDQEQILIDKFKNWKEDWHDEKLDIYSKVY